MWAAQNRVRHSGMGFLKLNSHQMTCPVTMEGDSESNIDLALLSAQTAMSAKWMRLKHHGSDQLPCVVMAAKEQGIRNTATKCPF